MDVEIGRAEDALRVMRAAILAEGRRRERAAIVAWLRREGAATEEVENAGWPDELADRLEQAPPGEYPA